MPSSACLPLGANGPVSAMEKPILMGSWASVGPANRAAVRAARPNRLAAVPPDARSRNGLDIRPPPGFQRFLPALYAGACAKAKRRLALSAAAVWELAHSLQRLAPKGHRQWRRGECACATLSGIPRIGRGNPL